MTGFETQKALSAAILSVSLTLGLAGVAQAEGSMPLPAKALRDEGIRLVYASNQITPDTREGLRLLEAAAADGEASALVSLGELYLYGTVLPKDWPKALDYFERAAEAGNAEGIHQYGMMLMWSQKNPAQAERTLVRAGELGVASAWSTLAEGAMYGYLGGGRASRAKFDGYAEKARAAGDARIEILDATRHMWGISVRASGPETIARLQAAADSGNAEAATFLIKLVRSGNRMNVRRDPARALTFLETYRPLLTEVLAWQLDLSIAAEMARGRGQWAEIADRAFAHPERITKDFGVDLFKANPNAAIFVVQRSLAAKNYDIGAADGFAGTRTLRAMTAACNDMAPAAACADSVMRADVIAALIDQL